MVRSQKLKKTEVTAYVVFNIKKQTLNCMLHARHLHDTILFLYEDYTYHSTCSTRDRIRRLHGAKCWQECRNTSPSVLLVGLHTETAWLRAAGQDSNEICPDKPHNSASVHVCG